MKKSKHKTKPKAVEMPQKPTPLELELQKQNRRENIVSGIFVLVIIVAFLFDLKIGAGALAFGLWSLFWYEQGKFSICCDEYEVGGYPAIGVRWMVKSWIWLAAFAIVANVIYECCYA